MSATMIDGQAWCKARARRLAKKRDMRPEAQAERARRQQEVFALAAALALPISLVLMALSALAR